MEIFHIFNKSCSRLKYVLYMKKPFRKNFATNKSQEKPTTVFEQLGNRTLIKFYGKDTSDFLQGVVTADVRQLQEGQPGLTLSCIYSMVLNVRGFVFCDIFMYKVKNNQDKEPLYLLECDKKVECELLKHLKLYKLRKKIDISSVKNDMTVWAAFSDPTSITTPGEIGNIKSPVVELQDENIITHSIDPRNSILGHRMILQKDADVTSLIPSSSLCDGKQSKYKEFRYKLGIGEGTDDHPPHNCFVQECNTDFLNGVSFDKGCYIGQELVSRVHYTGVVRRRIMPILLTENAGKEPEEKPEEYSVLNEKGARIGKFRGHVGKYGLALLKIADALKSEKLIVNKLGIEFKALRPEWWPKDMTKE